MVNVSVHTEGRYAFVELRTADMASASLQLNGQVQLLGATLSIGRPSGYVDPGKAAAAATVAAEALAKFQVGPAPPHPPPLPLLSSWAGAGHRPVASR